MNKNVIVIYLKSSVPCFSVQARHIQRLQRCLPDAEVIWCRTKEEFLDALPRARVVLTLRFKQEWFELAPCLQKIGTPAAGRDFFSVTSVPEQIEVRNGTFHGPVMAETIIGMLLAVNRGILTAFKHQLRGELWPTESIFSARLISGTHAVIIGFGGIGQHLGRRLKPFNVRVTGIRRYPPDECPEWFEEADTIRPLADLHRVLPDADHVIMLLPADTGTDNLISEQELALMSSEAVLYNFGRGNSVDEAALALALREGRIRGACLDVFAQEPLTEASPLADSTLPRLVRLPHASAYCESYIDRFLDEIMDWLR